VSSLDEAEFQIRSMLMFLARRYSRSADALSYCVVFLRELHGDEVSEIDTKKVALVRVIMKAHGFSNADLDEGKVSEYSRKRGTIRKRIDAFFREHINLVESNLELDRQRRNEPSFDPTFWQKQNVLEILRVVELVQQRELAEFLQKRMARQEQVAKFLQKLAAEKVPPKSA
jgi:hypothetical protein